MNPFEKLKAARTDADVLAALAEGIAEEKGIAPAEAPTPEALAEWWPGCPDAERDKATKRLQALSRLADPPDDAPVSQWAVMRTMTRPRDPETGKVRDAGGKLAGPPVESLRLAALIPERLPSFGDPPPAPRWLLRPCGPLALSRRWLEAHEAHPDNRPPHPLAPIVRAWIERPTRRNVYRVRRRASIPDFEREGAHLIGGVPNAFEERDPQLALPGFEPDGGPLPHWLLAWFRATGGPIHQGGRLPLELSLAVGGLARLGIGDRDGRWHTLHLPHRIEHEERFEGLDSVERWLWPDGWGGNRRARWHLIPEALHRLRRGWAGWLAVPGLGRVAVLAPSVIPERRADPLVELTLRIPRIAANGWRFDWPLFARYAVESAALARAYLSAGAHLHRSAHKGHPVTRMIAAPILDANGEPARRKGGAIVRSATEVAPNPQARFVRALTDTDLARMIGHPARTSRGRWQRHRAREVFERLAADGVIDLERAGKAFRIFGPANV